MLKPSKVLLFLSFLLSFTNSCDSAQHEDENVPSFGKIETAFRAAASENNIPLRIVMGVAYLQSKINPQKMSSVYVNTLDPKDQREKSIQPGQTAFGLPRASLGLENNDSADNLVNQIKAYGKFIGGKTKSLKFPADPQN